MSTSQVQLARAIQAPQNVLDLLERLHKQSLDQETPLKEPAGVYDQLRDVLKRDPAAAATAFNDVMRDKFIALDQDKASLVYTLARASGAVNILELGTSYGVSTIYLALAVGQNATSRRIPPGQARVIATEHEQAKAKRAREYWAEAGDSVVSWIDLREGDLLKTLQQDIPTLDLVLFDIWTPMVLPSLKLIESKLRPGAILVVDNVVSSKHGYTDFFEHVNAGPYTNLTLPYEGGLALIVYTP